MGFWAHASRFVLRNRIAILVVLLGITVYMGYRGKDVEITYEFAKLLPEDDPTAVQYEQFKKQFGQDGKVMFIGIEDDDLFRLDKFNAWYDLSYAIKDLKGVQEVVSVARLYNLSKNDSLQKFEFSPIIDQKPQSQEELDSLKEIIYSLPFYEGMLYSEENNTSILAITFNREDLNTKNRLAIVDSIKTKVAIFNDVLSADLHYSGLPFIRTSVARKIASEMSMFMGLAVAVTAIILFFFFRSPIPVFFSMIVVGVGVTWCFGTIELFNFKLTAISGLIAPLIIVIGVPNCILLLNRYQSEFMAHGNKARALTRSIEKVGISLFYANFTTAIGFAVFCFTTTDILIEFGLVASINVMLTYLISLVLIPIIYSFLPKPTYKHTRHLEGKGITTLLGIIDYWVHNYRQRIYLVVTIIVVVSLIGLTRMKAFSYVVDDLPKNDPVLLDLKYFESKYKGVLPFEVTIDTKKENGVFADNGRALYKINKLQKLFGEYEEFSKPASVAEAVKFSYQAYKNGKEKFYRLPGARTMNKIKDYVPEDETKSRQNYLKSFIDSTRQFTRVSVQMADIGSIRMKELVADLEPRIDTIFNYDEDNGWAAAEDRYEFTLTGHSLMFLKGNDFLVKNLIESVFLAIILISLVMFTLFMSYRMILVSVIPSLIPLMITAAIMGYFEIYLKPSTILIYSIAFGIASDGTLYFLTRYRQDFKKNQWSISRTVSSTIHETGVSMVYTAIILFSGFLIFTASDFGGTRIVGILIPLTLLIAYCSNLVLLPCFLLSLEKKLTNKAFLQEPLVQIYDEEEDIELEDLKVEKLEKAEVE